MFLVKTSSLSENYFTVTREEEKDEKENMRSTNGQTEATK